MKKIKVTKPGKLFLMGEYAVVAGYHAIITPTTWKLTVTISPANKFVIESTKWHEPVYFDFNGNHVETTEPSIWTKPLETAHRLAKALNIHIPPYRLSIESELDQSINQKWGLGSSGALTVAIIDAICKYINYPLTALELYKLSVISQLGYVDLTSYGDLACSSFDQPILYRMPSKRFLNQLDNETLLNNLNQTWPNLLITPIESQPLPLMVIHSNMKADSHTLVKQVFQAQENKGFNRLMQTMDDIVLRSYQAWQLKDMPAFKNAMHQYHQSLLKLEIISKTVLMTEPLKYLSNFAFQHQITHKFSGAGGGDNMLYFIDEPNQKDLIEKVLASTYPILNSYMKGIQK